MFPRAPLHNKGTIAIPLCTICKELVMVTVLSAPPRLEPRPCPVVSVLHSAALGPFPSHAHKHLGKRAWGG